MLSFGALAAALAVVPGAKADLVSIDAKIISLRDHVCLQVNSLVKFEGSSCSPRLLHAGCPKVSLAVSTCALQTETLLERSATNKGLNDRKRLATSYANFQRSR